jgi:hypothetical protein
MKDVAAKYAQVKGPHSFNQATACLKHFLQIKMPDICSFFARHGLSSNDVEGLQHDGKT